MEKWGAKLISRIVHDLKSPLASVEDALNLLAAEKVGNLTSVQRELLDLCRRNTGQVTSRIAKLAEWLRLEKGLVEFEMKPNDLVEVTESALQELRLKRSEVLLEWERPATPAPMECDASRIGQLIGELLGNAASFSEPGGSIAVRLTREPHKPPAESPHGWVRLSVENGCATIPNFPKEEIGEPFYPLRHERRSAAQGLGLGLAIVRAVAHAHNGELLFQRLEEGRVEFGVRLPVA